MIKIGVSGHRSITNLSVVMWGIETIFARLEQLFSRPFIIYSSLAEGADRLVAWKALEYADTKLIVPLPMRQSKFIKDFLSEQSRQEFWKLLARANEIIEMEARPSRAEAYQAAGRYILEQSELLITIWDGKQARGRGGTGQIVSEARQHGLPIAWVKTNDHLTHVMEDAVNFERLPASSHA